MRGIGQGQRIEIMVTPEVLGLTHKVLAEVEKVSVAVRAAKLDELKSKPAWTQRVLIDVIGWLLLNGVRAEEKKHRLLCQQNMSNLWRKAATDWLQTVTPDVPTWISMKQTTTVLTELCSGVDYGVSCDFEFPNTTPSLLS